MWTTATVATGALHPATADVGILAVDPTVKTRIACDLSYSSPLPVMALDNGGRYGRCCFGEIKLRRCSI